MIDKAHAKGMICNLFWSDDAEEAKAFFDMGIDVILTNHFLKTSGIDSIGKVQDSDIEQSGGKW